MNDKQIIEYVKINDLHFDPQNPRLPTGYYGADEEKVFNWMLQDASLLELMGAIGELGYFAGEPLLAYKEKGKTIVVEGNRRLAATKLLLAPEKTTFKKNSVLLISSEAKYKPEELPVILYPTREDVISYLGYRHVTGIKEWDSLEKARYLEQLFRIESSENNLDTVLRSLAKKIGSRGDYVARLLTGFKIYERIENNDFFGINDLDEETINFSVLTTAINYSNIANFIGLKSPKDISLEGLDIDNLGSLTDWLFTKNPERKTRIGESRNLSKLSEIVANEKALAAWRSGSTLQYAVMLTEAPVDIFKQSIFDAQSSLNTALSYSPKVDQPGEEMILALEDIRRIARTISNTFTNKSE